MSSPPAPPGLPAGYHRAWDSVVAALHADSQVRGATISGSVLRGEGGPTSDLDVYVLVHGRHRWRRTYVCEGVLVEEFRNSEAWIERYLREQDHIAMHMLGHGTRVLDRDGRLGVLCGEARALHARGPAALSEQAAVARRYAVWDGWCDAKDLLATGDPAQTIGWIQSQVVRAVEARHALERHWAPKGKRLLTTLRPWDPTMAELLTRFWMTREGDVRAAFAVFDEIVRHVLAPHDPDQPLLWVSEPQALEDDAAPADAPDRPGVPPRTTPA